MPKKSPEPAIAARKLKQLSSLRPTLAFILGSGFHRVANDLELEARMAYEQLPGFPTGSVAGHSGELFIGKLNGVPLLLLSGRAHFYEGYEMTEVTFGIRVLAAYGIKALLLTNAAGGLNQKFRPGDFMLVSDHINFMGVNPLRGKVWEGQERFVDLTTAYDPELRGFMNRAAKKSRMKIQSGVYLAICGPSYETPAEIRAFRRLGADAVGMSTVPETIVARQCGIRVVALSCITNLAAGTNKSALSHAEVLSVMKHSGGAIAGLLKNFVAIYSREIAK